MFDLIREYYRSKVSEYSARTADNSAIKKVLSEASNLVTERPADGGFVSLNQASDHEKGHIQSNQLEMIRQARKKWRWDPHARAVLQTLVNYTMGEGVTITPKSDDPMIWWIWREFWTSERNKMQLKQFELPLRLWRDGEVFLEFFSQDEIGRETGKTSIRFIDPLMVRNPASIAGVAGFKEKTTRNGIEHSPDDVEAVFAYWVQSTDNANSFRRVPAENVLHIKAFADSDQKRGESILQPILQLLTNYFQWLENRIILNKLRTAIVMIRKVSGTSAQVSSVVNNLKQASTARTGDSKRENIRGGTILTANAGVDYKMESPNINAADVKDDGRNIKLGMAAGTNLPEYVFGDSSNSNFASTLIAESPFVKAIRFWQTFLEYFWGMIFKRVMVNAAQANFIKAPSEQDFINKLKGVAQLTEQDDEGRNRREEQLKKLMPEGKFETPMEKFFGADMQWPEIVHRVEKDLTDALVSQRVNGWVSDASASQRLGYDYPEEIRKQRHIEEDAAINGNPLTGVKPEDQRAEDDTEEMDAEMADVLASMTPEQRQAFMDAKTPEDVASALKATTTSNGNGK